MDESTLKKTFIIGAQPATILFNHVSFTAFFLIVVSLYLTCRIRFILVSLALF